MTWNGTTAVALVYKFIQQFYSDMIITCPTDTMGYGISKKEWTTPQKPV